MRLKRLNDEMETNDLTLGELREWIADLADLPADTPVTLPVQGQNKPDHWAFNGRCSRRFPFGCWQPTSSRILGAAGRQRGIIASGA